jgi:acyl-CoA dehydrogenase
MMDFDLTEELKMLRDMTYDFALNEIAPISEQYDKEEKYTPEIRKKAAELGLVGAWIPEEYGGSGVGSLGNAIITEQLSRVDMGIGINISAAGIGCEAILLHGTEEQKQAFLPPVCLGKWVSAGAWTEPNAGTDISGYKTRALKDGDDYVITGNKMFITNGTVCDFMVIQAITNPEQSKNNSFSLVIVNADIQGITRNKLYGKMGIRASDTAEIALENVRVPRSNLIGKEGNGFKQLLNVFDVTRITIASQAVGISQACLEASVKYAKERYSFGAPLIGYQATQLKLTEMAIKIEALRNLVYKAAWLIDEGKPDYTLTAMAKYLGGQTAVFSANAAMEIHGGYGYMEEYGIAKLYRDAKILEIYEGTREAEIMTIGKVLQSIY